jgi:hypothetical protein
VRTRVNRKSAKCRVREVYPEAVVCHFPAPGREDPFSVVPMPDETPATIGSGKDRGRAWKSALKYLREKGVVS